MTSEESPAGKSDFRSVSDREVNDLHSRGRAPDPGGCDDDAPLRNPSPPSEDLLSTEDKTLLEADTIHNTVFSKHWVFSILMKLLKQVESEQETEGGPGGAAAAKDHGIDIDEDLESDLCRLWDMSANTEVSKFLQEWKSPDIFLSVISKTNAPRITEICMGVLGNMACSPDISAEFSKNQRLIDLSLGLMSGSDSPTMVETSRLIYTCLNNEQGAPRWLETVRKDGDFLRSMTFILQSSTNCDLIHNVADLVDQLLDLDDELLKIWSGPVLIQAISEALNQVGRDRPNTVSLLHHSLQIISTTDSGVDSLVEMCERVLPLVTAFISGVFENRVLAMNGRENTLASVVSVLCVMLLRSANTSRNLSEKESRSIKQLAEMLYIIHRKESTRSRKTSASEETSSSNSLSASSNKERGSWSRRDAGEDSSRGNGECDVTGDAGCHGDQEEEEEEDEERVWLRELLKDRLIDFFCCALDIAKKHTGLQQKLLSCGSARLRALRECLPEDRNDLVDLIDSIQGLK